jgi:hypothetical protein
MTTPRNYSIGRGLSQVYNKGVPRGLESELHVELSRDWPLPASTNLPTLRVPFSALAQDRQLSATSPPGGGIEWLGDRDLIYGIDILLRPSVVRASGASVVVGLSGNTAMPGITGLSAPPQWTTENAVAPPVDLTTTSVAVTPYRLTSQTIVSRQLVIMGGEALSTLIRQDLARNFSSIFDYMALIGRGPGFNEPRGILFTPGVINFPTGANLYSDLIDIEELIELESVSLNTFGYVTSPELKKRLRNTPKFAAGDADVWESITSPRSSPVVREQRIFAGAWELLLMCVWAQGFSITVDPYSRAVNAQVVLTGELLGDVGVRLPRAFGFSDIIAPPPRREENEPVEAKKK